jgi:2-haloalkanoic acid dehalogenase type II
MSTAVKAIFFDFMGTCLDWHSSVVDALPTSIPRSVGSDLAIRWREAFFTDIHARAEVGLGPENIDTTHRRLLLRLLGEKPWSQWQDDFDYSNSESNGDLSSPTIEAAVCSWHAMKSWSDVIPGLCALKAKNPDLELFVLANGTVRLQLELVRSAGLLGIYDLLFSSELLGYAKPSPEAYGKALQLVGVKPEEALMVACHAYDLRAARAVGMRTCYIRRETDDTDEDIEKVKNEEPYFLEEEEGMYGLVGVLAALDESSSLE